MTLRRGAAIEGYKVAVAEAGQNFNFVHELGHQLVIMLVEAFYGNFLPILELSWLRRIVSMVKQRIQYE